MSDFMQDYRGAGPASASADPFVARLAAQLAELEQDYAVAAAGWQDAAEENDRLAARVAELEREQRAILAVAGVVSTWRIPSSGRWIYFLHGAQCGGSYATEAEAMRAAAGLAPAEGEGEP